MTEQTIKSVRAEATLQEAEKWRTKLRALHNDLALMGDKVDTHYVCDRLYTLIKEGMEVMTREEAIKVLHELDGQLYETQIVALKMAIKALKAMNQIYKITGGYAEALYQSETTFDGVVSILTDYFEAVKK